MSGTGILPVGGPCPPPPPSTDSLLPSRSSLFVVSSSQYSSVPPRSVFPDLPAPAASGPSLTGPPRTRYPRSWSAAYGHLEHRHSKLLLMDVAQSPEVSSSLPAFRRHPTSCVPPAASSPAATRPPRHSLWSLARTSHRSVRLAGLPPSGRHRLTPDLEGRHQQGWHLGTPRSEPERSLPHRTRSAVVTLLLWHPARLATAILLGATLLTLTSLAANRPFGPIARSAPPSVRP